MRKTRNLDRVAARENNNNNCYYFKIFESSRRYSAAAHSIDCSPYKYRPSDYCWYVS